MKEYYPYTVIPQKVQSIMQERIPLPKLPKLIDAPEKVKGKYIGTAIFVLSLICFVVINLLKMDNIMITYSLLFVILIAFVAAIFEFVQHGKLKKHYEKEMKFYNERKKAYQKVKAEREKIEKQNKDDKFVDKFRQDKVHEFFSNGYDTINAVHNEYSLAKKRFKLFLEEYFSDEILDNVKVVHRTKKINYVPDFIVQIEKPKINVAIEIEEPYTLSNVPENIQKDYEAKSRLRQRFANELGWLVIIISEEQSILHPTECCKYIDNSMSEMLKDINKNKEFDNIKDIVKQKMLTGKERADLKKEKYREGYLIKAGLMDNPKGKNDKLIENVLKKDVKDKHLANTEKLEINNKKNNSDNKNDIKKRNNIQKSKDDEQMRIIKKYADKANSYSKKESVNSEKKDKNSETVLKTVNNKKDASLKKVVDDKKTIVEKQKITKENKSDNQPNNNEKVIKESSLKQSSDKILTTNKVETVEKHKVLNSTSDKENKNNTLSKNNTVKEEAMTEKEKKSVEEIIRKRKQDIKEKLKHREIKKSVNSEKPDTKTEKVVDSSVEEIKNKSENSKSTEPKISNIKKPEEKTVDIKKTEEKTSELKTSQKNAPEVKAEKKDNKDLVKLEKEIKNNMVKSENEQKPKKNNKQLMDSYHEQIEGAVFDKKWDELIELCNKAIKELPSWDWAYYRRSTAFGHKREFSRVILDCNKAIEYNPVFSEAYYNRGTARFFLGKYMNAINDYDTAISLNYVKKEEAHFNKGLCLLKLDNRKKAFREFLKSKELGYQKAEEIIKQYFSDEK